MDNVVQLSSQHLGMSQWFTLSELKLQIAQNLALDADLSGNAHKVASVLLFALIDGKTGWCFRKDAELAMIANVSLGTLRNAIKRDPAFRRFFEVTPGKRKGHATEYQLTQQAIDEAARRRLNHIKLLQRANGEMAIAPKYEERNSREPLVTKIYTNGSSDTKFCLSRQQNLQSIALKKHPPNPEYKPRDNPNCQAVPVPQKTVLPIGLYDTFMAIYPKRGDPKKIKAALRAAIAKGATQSMIIQRAEAYSDKRRNEDETYTLGPFRWLNEESWMNSIDDGHSQDLATQIEKANIEWIKSRHGLARTISKKLVETYIAEGKVSIDEARAAGIQL